jgi:hypothetical protein
MNSNIVVHDPQLLLTLLRQLEQTHVVVTGVRGSGKSTYVRQVLSQNEFHGIYVGMEETRNQDYINNLLANSYSTYSAMSMLLRRPKRNVLVLDELDPLDTNTWTVCNRLLQNLESGRDQLGCLVIFIMESCSGQGCSQGCNNNGGTGHQLTLTVTDQMVEPLLVPLLSQLQPQPEHSAVLNKTALMSYVGHNLHRLFALLRLHTHVQTQTSAQKQVQTKHIIEQLLSAHQHAQPYTNLRQLVADMTVKSVDTTATTTKMTDMVVKMTDTNTNAVQQNAIRVFERLSPAEQISVGHILHENGSMSEHYWSWTKYLCWTDYCERIAYRTQNEALMRLVGKMVVYIFSQFSPAEATASDFNVSADPTLTKNKHKNKPNNRKHDQNQNQKQDKNQKQDQIQYSSTLSRHSVEQSNWSFVQKLMVHHRQTMASLKALAPVLPYVSASAEKKWKQMCRQIL